MRLRRPTLTPSLVVSSLALFVALGGTGYAATGGNFVLGSANTADKTTSLTGTPASGAALKVTNANPGPAAAFHRQHRDRSVHGQLHHEGRKTERRQARRH